MTYAPANRFYQAWIGLCLILVFGMVVLGGLTRLTESGLSIVEWKLVSGILPPMSEQGWHQEFTAYQASPEYRLENHGMTLAEFKGIFWLEYLHRLLGRSIGLLLLAPLAWLWLKRAEPRWLRLRMTGIALLVGLQGVVGWFMVKSGLIDMPWVSPYRLALHLSLAVAILSLLLLSLLRLRGAWQPVPLPAATRRLCLVTLAAIGLQIALGAFVAGLDAGFSYNSFPLMDGDVVPAGMWTLTPWTRNLFENAITVQFLHRWWAFVTLGLVFAVAIRLWRLPQGGLRPLAMLYSGLALLQVALGIATLLLVVPLSLATLHQAVAMLLFGCGAVLCQRTASPQKTPDLTHINSSMIPVV